MEVHMQIVQSMYPLKSETWITKHDNDTFATWLQKEVDEIHEQLAWLARSPANSILMYQRCEINGYTFYTRAQNNKSTNQNNGVRIDATNSSGQTNSYFGYIE
jgi:4-alpha-glucanotransferase